MPSLPPIAEQLRDPIGTFPRWILGHEEKPAPMATVTGSLQYSALGSQWPEPLQTSIRCLMLCHTNVDCVVSGTLADPRRFCSGTIRKHESAITYGQSSFDLSPFKFTTCKHCQCTLERQEDGSTVAK